MTATGNGTGERPVRRYDAAVSTEAQALAWANREQAPHGAAVVVTHEVSARGRIGRVWTTPAEQTLACAVVIRPELPAEDGDAIWLAGGLAAVQAAEAVGGHALATSWPDSVVDAGTGEEVVQIKAQVQLGPGRVRHAVVTARFDLARLGIDDGQRAKLLDEFLTRFDTVDRDLDEDGEAYTGRCRLVGQRVRLRLLPKGETRGVARRVDRRARLVVESATGMIERIAVDSLRDLEVVGGGGRA